MKIRGEEEIGNFECEFCNDNFTQEITLKKHIPKCNKKIIYDHNIQIELLKNKHDIEIKKYKDEFETKLNLLLIKEKKFDLTEQIQNLKNQNTILKVKIMKLNHKINEFKTFLKLNKFDKNRSETAIDSSLFNKIKQQ